MAADNGRSTIRKIDNALAKLPEALVKEALTLASDINATIADRVQNDGQNADGGTFGDYAASTRKQKVKKGQTSSPYPLVNFTDTGLMFANIKPTVERKGTKVVITLKASNKAEIDKLRWNTDRFGEILEASKDEQDQLKKDIEKRYRKLLKSFL